MADQEVILITGSNGRVGRSVIKRFEGKYRLVGFDLVAPKQKFHNYEYVFVDLTSDDAIKRGLNYFREKYGSKIASTIHLAKYYNYKSNDYAFYEKVNVEGTERILKALESFQVEQLIFFSTQMVYAPCELGRVINESSLKQPRWSYPRSKMEGEKLIHERCRIQSKVILQAAGCYDEDCHSIPMAHQIQRIYEGDMTGRLFPGCLNHGRAYVHLSDIAEVIWLAVEKRKQLSGEVDLIIGEENTLSYDEMQRIVSRLISGREIVTHSVPKCLAKLGLWLREHLPWVSDSFMKSWMVDIVDDHYALDTTKARIVLGWEAKHSIEDVLPKIVENLKRDPLTWYKRNGLVIPKKLKKQLH